MNKLMSNLVIGQQVNRLTVLSIRSVTKKFRTGSVRNVKEVFVACECGRKKWIRYEHVKGGRSKSCGCLNYEPRCSDPRRRAANRVVTYTRQSARIRELPFELNVVVVERIIFLPCFYCGEPPRRVFDHGARPYAVVIPCHGLDRLDSSLGYEASNVVPCCRHCNTMKLDLTVEDFLAAVGRVASRAALIRKQLEERAHASSNS